MLRSCPPTPIVFPFSLVQSIMYVILFSVPNSPPLHPTPLIVHHPKSLDYLHQLFGLGMVFHSAILSVHTIFLDLKGLHRSVFEQFN